MSITSSFLQNHPPPDIGQIIKAGFALIMESLMIMMFFAIYSETVNFLSSTYLSELPLIGIAFQNIAPDANASHLVCGLLAIFSVATPLFVWAQVFEHDIFNPTNDWFSHKQNQVLAWLTALILLLVIGLECLSLYTLISQQGAEAGTGFVTTEQSGVMAWLAQNKGMGIGVSIMIAIINITLALFTAITLRQFKSQENTHA